jgi:hypothetical protein
MDFVWCDLRQFQPVLVVELDDASHERVKRRELDAVADACRSAAVPTAGSRSVPLRDCLLERNWRQDATRTRTRDACATSISPP